MWSSYLLAQLLCGSHFFTSFSNASSSGEALPDYRISYGISVSLHSILWLYFALKKNYYYLISQYLCICVKCFWQWKKKVSQGKNLSRACCYDCFWVSHVEWEAYFCPRLQSIMLQFKCSAKNPGRYHITSIREFPQANSSHSLSSYYHHIGSKRRWSFITFRAHCTI